MTAKVQRQQLEIPIPDLSSENAAGTVGLHRILDGLGVPR